jgi:hypothetical protein
MSKYFPPQKNFSTLSVSDLLEARDHYHVHLTNLENVVGTAVGFYRIRKKDADCEKYRDPEKWRSRKNSPERTLANTEVQPWSWPCVLVFVDAWLTQEKISKQMPDQVVPRFLYLPDGRVVPTCVILAKSQVDASPLMKDLTFPSEVIGGGYPVFTVVQGEQHIGSIGCLVTDGGMVYALTSRHVAGMEGQAVYSLMGGKDVRIGHSCNRQVARKPLKQLYPDYAGSHFFGNLDAGLVQIEDATYWTSQVFGIGELVDPADMHSQTISLRLIGCPVRAFGGASGELVGEIQALFYRYKSLAGFEYVSDVLIGPRSENEELNTHPGDSGTIWFVDEAEESGGNDKNGGESPHARRLRPIAMQWGGHVIQGSGGQSTLRFALATWLSTICRELDVDVVTSWNTGYREYWGKTGHYKLAAKACELVKDAGLKSLLMNNVALIGFDDAAITAGDLKTIDTDQFVPLADVPDLVWRVRRPKDASNHFADMDEQGKGEFENKTLLDLCKQPEDIDVATWNKFYESIDVDEKRGALPFRVWQIFRYMMLYAKQGDIPRFVCAGGVLSHYVADACQPLHVSRLHHGENAEEKGVHSIFETKMLDRFAVEMIQKLNDALAGAQSPGNIKDGKEAAVATVALMAKTFELLPPEKVLRVYNEEEGRQRLPHMWSALGDETVECLASGTLLMAALWESAWKCREGNQAIDPGAIGRDVLKKLYLDRSFLPAYTLSDRELVNELTPNP